jgi:hypothetical protein
VCRGGIEPSISHREIVVVTFLRYPIFAAALLILTVGAVPCQGQAADRDTLLKPFFEAAGPKERKAAITEILAAAPDPLEVERGLRRGRVYP